MENDLEKLTQSIEESIRLIEQNVQIKASPPSLLQSPDEVLDTPSLLSRCESICQLYGTHKKPTLRVIHHLACSGGSLISKCISALPNVYLLSEVHPFTHLGFGKDKPKYSPTDLIALSHYASVPQHNVLARKLFKQSIDTIYKHIEEIGGILVLRDHTHSDYCTAASIPKKSTLISLLEEDYKIESILTIRDPIDSYISLNRNGWVHFLPNNFDEYCRRVLLMLEQYKSEQVFRYEDFVEKPKKILYQITQQLDLPFDDNFEDIFGCFKVTGDSGRSSERIMIREKITSENIVSEMQKNKKYKKLIELIKQL